MTYSLFPSKLSWIIWGPPGTLFPWEQAEEWTCCQRVPDQDAPLPPQDQWCRLPRPSRGMQWSRTARTRSPALPPLLRLGFWGDGWAHLDEKWVWLALQLFVPAHSHGSSLGDAATQKDLQETKGLGGQDSKEGLIPAVPKRWM